MLKRNMFLVCDCASCLPFIFFILLGPWFDGEQDKKFQTAYTADAAAAGYTLERALALRKANEAKKQQQQQQEH